MSPKASRVSSSIPAVNKKKMENKVGLFVKELLMIRLVVCMIIFVCLFIYGFFFCVIRPTGAQLSPKNADLLTTNPSLGQQNRGTYHAENLHRSSKETFGLTDIFVGLIAVVSPAPGVLR